MRYWIVKTEPSTYSWETFEKEKSTFWNGVRNYQARNNMRLMKKGDMVLFYHSGDERQIVGIAKVTKEAYPDHTAKDPQWCMVDISYVKPLKKPVTLTQVKLVPELKDMKLVKQGRLSVAEVSEKEFQMVLSLGETK
ncbi:EVE domain-containing protein [Candidatus Gracilibacteria bacterium]|nr:EVE domain-containing protein [Candidatus Gracilibacteria bacterium]